MQYDFDTVVDRRGTNSLKWAVGGEELPMWVADMDFLVAPEIQRAITQRAAHGIFGYTEVPGDWYRAISSWWAQRHGLQIPREWILYCTGVVPAISSAIRKLTTPGEKVLVQTPVYNIFYNCIRNNGRQVVENRLVYDGGRYHIDFADLQQKLADPQTTMMLLCNPHNPIGKIWDRTELEEIGALCRRHHVLVLADEIHCDLTDPGQNYTPFAAVSNDCRQNSITCVAPTKTFNLAGLQTSAVLVPNGALRHRVERALGTDEIAEPNTFAITAAVAAYTSGGPWLEALRSYLYQNKQMAAAYLKKELPQVQVVPSTATYLLWLDCRQVRGSGADLADHLRQKTGLYLSGGAQFGGGSEQFLRMNIACPRAQLYAGLQRLKRGVLAYEAWWSEQF
ncbi:Cystathionine beta-lyase PatB [Anaerotruncus sp. 2789STDY5834896]|uniref:cysteine-S-conjugate beta-lyase n=1 Tax=uncultured Anaerotruncus sp. TaxID=905011 RepID=A0A1C6HEY6_9FIRM|nr:Cystathionine beta-lyase PatB [uncultured Anaerotruncus sp.]